MAAAAISVNGNVVEPTAQQEGGSHFAADASHSNYLLIHCVDRLKSDQLEELKRLEVTVLQYIAGDTYFCRYMPAELEEIRRLPYVIYANVYHPDYVVENVLKSKASSTPERSSLPATTATQDESPLQAEAEKAATEELHDVLIVLHADCDGETARIKHELAAQLGIDPATIHEGPNRLQMKLSPEDLETVARFDDVQRIEEVRKAVLKNHLARQVINLVDPASLKPAVKPEVYSAEGEVVALADSGIDSSHKAFQKRLLKVTTYRATGTSNDISGHGTHCSASAVGNADSTKFGPIKGTAPGAKLVMQTVFDETDASIAPGGLRFGQMFLNAHRIWGVRTHSNSWGGDPLGPKPDGPFTQDEYTEQAADIDKVVSVAGDLTILFAAGNEGQWLTDTKVQIGNQPAAKNIITVGACESTQPLRYSKSGMPFPAYMYEEGKPVGNPDNVADFSSLGPTKNTGGTRNNSRIKPDVVAPGTTIYSARSQDPGLAWPKVGEANRPDYYGIAPDNKWLFSIGTSMATPLVAGCCAVIRRVLRQKIKGGIGPKSGIVVPAALVKAVLINGTTNLAGVFHSRGPSASHGGLMQTAPGPDQGFGRVNLAKSLLCITDPDMGGFYPKKREAQVQPLREGESYRIKVPLKEPPNGQQLVFKATMCYTDKPSVAGSGSLINVLNLKVIARDGTFRYGNTGTQTSDDQNNVQKVVWNGIPSGDAEIVVECKSIGPTNQSQHFAVAYYTEYGPPALHQALYTFWNLILPSAKAGAQAMLTLGAI
jgi:serine protease AprX